MTNYDLMNQDGAGKNIAIKQEEKPVALDINIIKKYICPTATEQETYMFLQLCKAQNLNPFLREAYLIKYGSDTPAFVVVGKETFTKRADKQPQYDGFRAGIIVISSGVVIYREGSFHTSSEILLGGWAEVYRKDRKIPFRNEVKLDEYIGRKKDGGISKMWQEKSATMIRKVSLTQSLREAFPDAFGGLYSPEEINTIQELPQYEMGQDPVIPVPVPSGKPEVRQPEAKNDGDIHQIITGLLKVTKKEVENSETKKKFPIFTVYDSKENTYTSTNEKFATLAKTSIDNGIKVKLQFKTDKYGNKIAGIDLIEGDEPKDELKENMLADAVDTSEDGELGN